MVGDAERPVPPNTLALLDLVWHRFLPAPGPDFGLPLLPPFMGLVHDSLFSFQWTTHGGPGFGEALRNNPVSPARAWIDRVSKVFTSTALRIT